jgi:hypothetical protein
VASKGILAYETGGGGERQGLARGRPRVMIAPRGAQDAAGIYGAGSCRLRGIVTLRGQEHCKRPERVSPGARAPSIYASCDLVRSGAAGNDSRAFGRWL